MKNFVTNIAFMLICTAAAFAQHPDYIQKDSFLLSSVAHQWSEKMKKAIFQFQKDRHLKNDLFDFETFKLLRIHLEGDILSDLHDENDSGISLED